MIYVVTERQEYFESLGWTSFSELFQTLAVLDFNTELQVDTETTGLKCFLREKVHCIQIGTQSDQYIFDLETIDPLHLKRLLEEKLLVGHNLLFDLPHLYNLDIRAYKIYDTFVAESLLFLGLLPIASRAKGLGDVVKRYLYIDIDKSLQKEICEGLNSVEDIEYAATDVTYLFRVRDEQMKLINRRGLQNRLVLENRFTPVLAYMEFTGFPIDKELLYKYIRECEYEETVAEKKLKTYADINWNSTKQVGEYLKEHHGIEIIDEDTGNLKTGEDVLSKFKSIPLVQDLLELRGAAKKVNTYGRKWFHYIQADGRIHTRYKQLVDTGRTSCGQVDRKKFEPWNTNYTCDLQFPNVQNIPRKTDEDIELGKITLRDCFVADGNNTFIVCDFSAQESVVMADRSKDPELLRFFSEGLGDMHCYVARLVYPQLQGLTDKEIKENHPSLRTIAKTASFAIAYGGNGQTVADNLQIPVEQGEEFYTRYMEVFGGIKSFFKKCFDYASTHGYMPCDNIGGKRYFDKAREFVTVSNDKKYWDKYYEGQRNRSAWYEQEKEKMKWFHAQKNQLRKDSVNTVIQGISAEMSKLAGIYFFKWIIENNLWKKVGIAAFVHDEWVPICHQNMAQKVATAIQETMERAGKECLETLSIKAEANITKVWNK